jgi:transposase
MFGLGLATRIYVGLEAVDMRKGFEGLFGLVRDYLGQDPLSGHLFLFVNRGRTRIKAIVWDGSGLWVCAKRLERGRFRWPEAREGDRHVTMRPEQLTLLLNGMDLTNVHSREGWYRRQS